MNHDLLLLILALVLLIAAVSVVAERYRFPSPILMLVVGAVLAFVPGVPAVRLDPDVVFLILLPPLLYSSGVGMSWRGFRSSLRPILLLAVGSGRSRSCTRRYPKRRRVCAISTILVFSRLGTGHRRMPVAVSA